MASSLLTPCQPNRRAGGLRIGSKQWVGAAGEQHYFAGRYYDEWTHEIREAIKAGEVEIARRERMTGTREGFAKRLAVPVTF